VAGPGGVAEASRRSRGRAVAQPTCRHARELGHPGLHRDAFSRVAVASRHPPTVMPAKAGIQRVTATILPARRSHRATHLPSYPRRRASRASPRRFFPLGGRIAPPTYRHAREGGHPGRHRDDSSRSAVASRHPPTVMPANAGIQGITELILPARRSHRATHLPSCPRTRASRATPRRFFPSVVPAYAATHSIFCLQPRRRNT